MSVSEDEGWGADASSRLSSGGAGEVEFEDVKSNDSGADSSSGTTSVHEDTTKGARGSENRGGVIESVASGSDSDLSSIAKGTGACWNSEAEDEYEEGAGAIGVDGEENSSGVTVVSAFETIARGTS